MKVNLDGPKEKKASSPQLRSYWQVLPHPSVQSLVEFFRGKSNLVITRSRCGKVLWFQMKNYFQWRQKCRTCTRTSHSWLRTKKSLGNCDIVGAYFNGWGGDPQPQQHLQKHRLDYSGRQTYYEPSFETTKEVVLGAVQEPEGEYDRMEMKTPEDGDPFFDHYDLRH